MDYLFTWNRDGWPYEKLRSLVDGFRSKGVGEEPWRCFSHKKIRVGDRAYLLKQGDPIGIFGRGTVVGTADWDPDTAPGQNHWKVPIRFESSRGDVLVDPEEQFLVDGVILQDLAPKKQWQIRASGMPLATNAARGIDRVIDSIVAFSGQSGLLDENDEEVARRMKLIELAMRPDQQQFSDVIRRNYRNRCPITGCVTRAALEAAHINAKKGADDNSRANGILLRSDIHGLLDSLLITLSEDGTRVQTSPDLTDPTYSFLKTVVLTRPDGCVPPSVENIREHRKRFFERSGRRS